MTKSVNKSVDIRSTDLQIINTILIDILPENSKVWVFGSRARGKTRKASDLDLAIDAGRCLLKKEQSDLFHAFEDSDLPYKVDVVDLYTINDNLRKIIEEEMLPLPDFSQS